MVENHRNSLIQQCERSELRLHFEWTKVHWKCPKWFICEFFENLKLAVKQCYQRGPFKLDKNWKFKRDILDNFQRIWGCWGVNWSCPAYLQNHVLAIYLHAKKGNWFVTFLLFITPKQQEFEHFSLYLIFLFPSHFFESSCEICHARNWSISRIKIVVPWDIISALENLQSPLF